ncbi:MAG: carotenoid 1,2-hydratase [Chloroflexi bacterium]|nr:MAG: carotenoid 1,2-hydratase [Chloroflexota bacterium]
MRLIIIIVVLVIASGVALARWSRVEPDMAFSAQVEDVLLPEDDAGFARARQVIPIRFPQDLGQHPEYKLEWWYYTGNLVDRRGQRFGFQLTFFRRGLAPGLPDRPSAWATRQIYFAHFTITDAAGEQFYFRERFSRGSPGLAGAQAEPYRVWLDDWQAVSAGPEQVRLKAQTEEVALDLRLTPRKPVVLHGDQGLSKKGEGEGNASYYYSFTRNEAVGTVTTPRGRFDVTGLVWKDHEWSTSGLGAGVVGWDWFSLQLDDGREVMYFILRQADNSPAPLSGGTLVEANGTTRELSPKEVSIKVLNRWTSPHTGAVYPAEWQFTIPGEGIDLHIRPLAADQELRVSTVYWEGAVQAEGTRQGYGYIELTGYAGSMEGRM